MMKLEHAGTRSLREMELEVLEEGREWMRQRLEQNFRRKPPAKAGFSPSASGRFTTGETVDESAKRRGHRSAGGVAREDPGDKHWGCPIREKWGLKAHQQMSPVFEEKLASPPR